MHSHGVHTDLSTATSLGDDDLHLPFQSPIPDLYSSFRTLDMPMLSLSTEDAGMFGLQALQHIDTRDLQQIDSHAPTSHLFSPYETPGTSLSVGLTQTEHSLDAASCNVQASDLVSQAAVDAMAQETPMSRSISNDRTTTRPSSMETDLDHDTLYTRASSGGSSLYSAKCECYRFILRRLLEFDDARVKDGRKFAIDLIMTLEWNLQEQTARTLECTNCCKRTDLLMLLVMANDSLIRLFDSISCPRSGQHSTRFGSSPNQPHSTKLRGSKLLALFDSRALIAGNMEICASDKILFLKQFLRRRLGSLSAMLNKLQSILVKAPQSAMITTATTLILDGRRRLNTVLGRLELLDDAGVI
jgi:hypothetical protein